MSRFFADIGNGLQVDILAFTKLDRLFRSVKLYYQAMDVLEKHHVAWQAIQEDYETITASGRMKVNIMLSVAENEADRTSERIKVVFERKIANGECVNPRGLPIGYKCEDKKVVPSEDAEAARAVFEHYATHGNKCGARNFLQDEYGINITLCSMTHLLTNRLYIGEYRGNLNYCEPIISRELFDQVQDTLERRATRKTPTGYVYLFTGITFCKECGRRMCSGRATDGRKNEAYYRCHKHYYTHDCDNNKMPREHKIETFLLTHIEEELKNVEYEYTKKQKQKKPPVNRAAIQKKLERLKDLYVDGLITKEQYTTDYTKFQAQLSEPVKRTDFSAVKKALGSNFNETYASFSREEKKTFWRAILDHLEINKNGDVFIYFRQ